MIPQCYAVLRAGWCYAHGDRRAQAGEGGLRRQPAAVRMKPPLPVGHGQRLCPRGGAVAVLLPAIVSCARPHRLWGLAFSLPFWRWWKTQRRGAAAGGLRPPARCRASPAAGMFWGRGLWPRPQNAAAPPAERPGGRGGACRAPGLAALGPAKAIAPWPAGFSLGKGC